MGELRATLLEELIELAYAERGYAPLSEQETDQLVRACVQQVEDLSFPPQEGQVLKSAGGK